ncbi:SusC/RagA family TonB-linked outer membrane protein [Dyadobacter fanqingshengii]|uniref:SusC/RagA family TonB-linked outer membrane protein n=1 Tax=Dyadobacter fanqingshengii TaxID=2906443 RepID=A0A9X1P5Z2_9BACT|nr:SusC/RagA family TonB-linked outer membrane protein [Dyadobacter fanqingshengii]MCF0039459.1 SusC/RagA family TonB-linked outer membrane protein [Dyadobacter fanqingshengii]USJ33731.1 SusC/RagA family TonB-linked outer membrane protein [Dyadobacter fanqingshengii]
MKRGLQCLLLTLLVTALFNSVSMAQDRQLTGKVNDENGAGIPGANILIKGTTRGTNTDAEGTFTITMGATGTLIISSVGYSSKEVEVTSAVSNVNVNLEPDVRNLGEVVVTALGISKEQKTLSYATQMINTDNFSKARELNVANSLSGRVAGLDIVRSSSGVGGSSRVVLRGDRSITGNNQALIVVDGVPIDNSNFSPGNANGGRDASDGLSSINPDDIESINVLRGASATALYGSRAANGALLITTKKGAVRKGVGVNISSTFQMEQAMELQKFQNVYGQGVEGKFQPNSEFSWGPKMDGQQVAAWGPDPDNKGKTYAYSPQPNSYKDFYSTGTSLANSVSLTAGNEKVQTYFSYTNTSAKGVVSNNKLNRNNFNLRLSSQITSKLSFDGKVTYLSEKIENRQQTGEAFANLQRHILRLPRSISLDQAKDFEYVDPATGKTLQNYWNPGSNGGQNPYWIKNRVLALDNRDRIYGFTSLNYKATPWLTVMGRAGYDKYIDKFEGKWYTNTYTIADFGDYQTNWRDNSELNLDLFALVSKQFSENFKLDATVGGNILQRDYVNHQTLNNGLNRDNLFVTTNARNSVTNRTVTQTRKQGVFASADLIWRDALTLSASARNDWSSTLPTENQSYFFPSVGAAAVLSSLFNLPQAISFAKIRGSYALTGNDASPYLLAQTYSYVAGGNTGYIVRDNIKPFPSLKPELTTAREIGLEAKFLQNRIGFDVTLYSSNSKNQLFQVPLSRASGWSFEYINAGDVKNSGIEVTFNVAPIKTESFSWNLDLNYARNVNEVVKLSDRVATLPLASDFMNFVRAEEGKALGQIYSRGFQRDDQGRIKVGANGIPLVTASTTVPLGTSRPSWTGGVTNRFSYKGFNLSFLISGRIGGVVTSFTNAVIYADGVTEETLAGRDGMVVEGVQTDGSANTVSTTAEAYWKFVGGRNTPIGEAFTYSASNIRLREATLGYSIPASVLAKSPFQGASLSIVGRNLFFLMNKAKGFDPELVAGSANTTVGLESFSMPSTRSLGVSLNLTF